MSIGQIVPQMPFSGAPEKSRPVPAEPLRTENKPVKARPFATVLRDLPSHENATQTAAKMQHKTEVTATESGDKQEQQTVASATEENRPSHTQSNAAAVVLPEKPAAKEVPAEAGEQHSSGLTIPQNVDANAVGVFIALVPQMIGRMPESDLKPEAPGATVVDVASRGIQLKGDNSLIAEKTVVTPVMLEASPVANVTPHPATPTVTGHELSVAAAITPDMPTQQTMGASVIPAASALKRSDVSPRVVEEPMGAQTTSQSRVSPESDVKKPAAPVNPDVQVEKPTLPLQASSTAVLAVAMAASRKEDAPAIAAPIHQQTQNAPAALIADENVAPVQMAEARVDVAGAEIPASHAMTEIPAAKIPPAPAVTDVPMQRIMEAYSRPFTAVADAQASPAKLPESQPAPVVVQTTQPSIAADSKAQMTPPAAALPEQNTDTAPTVAREAVVRGTAAPVQQEPETQKAAQTTLPAMTVIPGQSQAVASEAPVQRAIETGAVPAHAVVRNNPDRTVRQEEKLQQSTPEVADVKASTVAGKILPEALKAVSASTSGEDSGNNKSPHDPAMGGQMLQGVQQQAKTESAPTATPSTSAAPAIAEQVIKQVGEHFAKNEIKNGSEQIVLRLSPENLGELKVNIKMENQRLTVEIVAENRMVRDAILQNSDALKDSLAKQNIKMDSFDVTTGGNSSGFGARNQNEWREVAQNRQSHQWQHAGGYNLPKDFVPEKSAYNRPAEYGMLDVHY